MDYKTKLEQLITENNGLVLTKMADQAGIPRQYLSLFVKEGKLERVAQGIYLTVEAFEDEMYCLQARNTRVVFSHETALFLHELTDRDPIHFTVTIPAGYNGTNLREAGTKVFSVKSELYGLGLIESETQFGRMIKTYDLERTICDIVRSRSQVDVGIMTDALKKYSNRNDKSISNLMIYGEKFGIMKLLKQYMEVLL
ncbi:type IV toxin-antitoxin system AbiEi family antitoxin domain-containing protein [Fusibacter sp. 3D3]|uniref:type IV toxin-antitoxin system AbiEi family antitoxin domain-containing protein n=1 Tax=Fusibacter sp. 3D3 TaxID=1048380 RepID=UPI00085384BB|nr:type IV toxin-antitoxin system AbiEi family antitoxin domain-containing protein [Fusibacter sp. 3D3]GAU75828.1 abortive infection protein AbiGI [Fusibacter sp. 3D3]